MRELWGFWTVSFAADAGRYVIAAGLAFLIFWVWGRERFRHRLVNGAYAPTSQLRRELAYSASTAVIFSLVGVLLKYGARAGVFHLYEDLHEHGLLYFGATVVLLLVLHDAYYYWTHRAMHHPWVFKRMHMVHHTSKNPSPWAAYAFSPSEAVVQAAFVPLVLLVLPAHILAVFVFLLVMIVKNVIGHLGLELFPSGFVKSRWLGLNTTTTHHAMHHTRVNENFGLYFTFWDRVMGTESERYEEAFERVAGAGRAPSVTP